MQAGLRETKKECHSTQELGAGRSHYYPRPGGERRGNSYGAGRVAIAGERYLAEGVAFNRGSQPMQLN